MTKLLTPGLSTLPACYFDMIDIAPDMMAVADLYGCLLICNRAFTTLIEQISGHKIAPGICLQQAIPPALPASRLFYEHAPLRQVLGIPMSDVNLQQDPLLPPSVSLWSGEGQIVCADNRSQFLAWTVSLHTNETGQPLYRSVVLRDISEQKAAEEALLRTQARLEEAQRVARVGSWEFDLTTQKIVWSTEMFLLSERDPAEGEPDYQEQLASYAPEDAARLDAAVRRAIQEGIGYTLDLHRVRNDGSIRSFYAVGNPIKDATGRVVRLVGTCMDISEREQLESQLRQVQKMDCIGRLAGGIAHDFNNLLAVIMGYAELVAESLPVRDSLQESVQNIQGAATRAANLTQQLLAFAHKQAISPKFLRPNNVLTSMITMLKPLIGEAIELSISCDPNVGTLYIDESQLEQVIVNLVVNARDAMPSGGKLTLKSSDVHLEQALRHERALMPAGDYAVLTITDTGIGMTEEVKQRLFEPFFTTKEKGKGTGLGLATVYGIVKQNRGYVWVYSEIGIGTTFRVYLPCTVRTAEPAEPQIKTIPDASGTETILLAEDEPMLREMAAFALRQRGYQVLEAANGVEAIDMAEAFRGKIDLLLTDAIMPRMGGLELASKLRTTHPEIAILLVSGYSEEMFTGQAISLENIRLLQKPFTPTDLLARVRATLSAR